MYDEEKQDRRFALARAIMGKQRSSICLLSFAKPVSLLHGKMRALSKCSEPSARFDCELRQAQLDRR